MRGSGADKGEEAFAGLGTCLVMLRVQRGLTQAELAARARIRPNQVSRYETGQVYPQLPQLGRLLDALAIDLVDFFLFFSALRTWNGVLTLSESLRGGDLAEARYLIRQLAARQVRSQDAVRAGVERLIAEIESAAAEGQREDDAQPR